MGLEHEEELGLYFAAAIILVEQRQYLPGFIVVPMSTIAHRGKKFLGRAIAADQGIQPGKNGCFTTHPRLRALGRLSVKGHTTSSLGAF
jgi:hypothetical protein